MEIARIPNKEPVRTGEKILPFVGNDASQIKAISPSMNEIPERIRIYFCTGKFYYIYTVRYFVLHVLDLSPRYPGL